jgi:hypothetical protein
MGRERQANLSGEKQMIGMSMKDHSKIIFSQAKAFSQPRRAYTRELSKRASNLVKASTPGKTDATI